MIGAYLVSNSSFDSYFIILHPKDKNTHDDSLSVVTVSFGHNPNS